jgi:hypothetical protein
MTQSSVIKLLGLERLAARVARRYAAGADLSSLILPLWLDALLNHDWVAYPLHATCGSLLNLFALSPRVTALEWLKAAAHAESSMSQRMVGAGLRRTLLRAQSLDIRATLTAALVRPVTQNGRDVQMRRRQLAALARAGLDLADERNS